MSGSPCGTGVRPAMRNRGPVLRGRSSGIIMLMLSSLACVYTAGRLWQDAKIRQDLVTLAQRRASSGGALSTEDSLKLLNLREQAKQISILEMDLAAARLKGYVSDVTINSTASGSTKLLAVIGINTGFGQKARRDSIRHTWMSKDAISRIDAGDKVVLRFCIGRSANRGDSSDKQIEEESGHTKDFLVLDDHVEGYDELPKKTKIYFATVIKHWDADFYIKVDDDVYINVGKMAQMLRTHREKSHVYVGCMKSGEVYSESTQRWHEPEWWKFGDAKSYFRHATGQVYGLSKALAYYVAINRPMLHEYRNEDVSLGSWMLGLNVEHVDERRLCCGSPPEGDCQNRKQEDNPCIAVFDWRCSGICNSVQRMLLVHESCG
eukprot:SM000307S11696  [mRNA]  locus=s307:63797:67350:- [translate_table: standard]